jgi:cytochrome P450
LTHCPHLAAETADWLDSGPPPPVVAPYFDTQLDGWVLSRYADVLAAFQSPDLLLVGATSKKKPPAVDEAARRKMRAETTRTLSTASLCSWSNQMLSDGRTRAAAFDFNQPVDLIKDYAVPLCLALAMRVTQPGSDDPERLFMLAVQVAAAAEEPLDGQLKAEARIASEQLGKFFHTGPEPLREQGFVALSRTMVHLLGNAWFALLRHPEGWKRLHTEPACTQSTAVARGMEELLRFAGLTRLLFRRAIVDTTINSLPIRQGERVILRIHAANRDRKRFPNADVLSLGRPGVAQMSLGAGRHHCVGAPLIRVAATAATLPLVERFPPLRLAEPVRWRGGSGYSAPAALLVLPADAE